MSDYQGRMFGHFNQNGQMKSNEDYYEEEIASLRSQLTIAEGALERALKTIRTWHGMGIKNVALEEDTWRSYQNSPEMKFINEALRAIHPPEGKAKDE